MILVWNAAAQFMLPQKLLRVKIKILMEVRE